MTSAGPSPVEFLADPLSPLARLERRNLLFASTVGFLVAKAGLLPTQIAVLGMSFSAPEQRALLFTLLVVVIYFAAAFLLYGVSDLLVWREKFQNYLERVAVENENWTEQDQRAYDAFHTHVPEIAWLYRASKPVVYMRLAFEFLLPLVLALAVCVVLARSACGA